MKTILLVGLIGLSNLCFCQAEKSKQIDSLVEKILKYRDDYYKAGGSQDSIAVELYYTDSNGRNLVHVDELTLSPDTTSVHFFFQDKKLIKVEAHYFDGKGVMFDEFYFADGKYFYSRIRDDIYFTSEQLFNRGKKYLAFKPKQLYSNKLIIH